METKASRMLDAPDRQDAGSVLFYSFFGFLVLPLVLRLIGLGVENNHELLSWYEIGLHVLSFMVVVPLMREYLGFSWLVLRTIKDDLITWCAIAVGLLLGYSIVIQVLGALFLPIEYGWIPESTMPILTINLYLTNTYQILLNPVFATVCAVLVAPLVTTCIFYASVFSKAYNIRPWLGYGLVILATLFSRLASSFSGVWDLKVMLVEFAVQLPAHLICCWLYQKLDSVWAPVFAQAIVNFVACIGILFLW